MKTWADSILLLAVTTAIPGLLAFAAATPDKPAAESAATKEVRQLNTEEVQAMLRADAAALAHLWSDDLVVNNPLHAFVHKQQVLDLVKTGFLAFTSYDRQIEYIRDYGNTVIVAGHETLVFSGKMPNAGRPQRLRFTAVWMKQHGRWQEVARHADVVPPQ
ncbi:MAG TPA: nuclear transport factor 2 family protein [Terriglobales bacterium]|nr:nuclear transport factor 2 family protein [Terriglobales bacterium]